MSLVPFLKTFYLFICVYGCVCVSVHVSVCVCLSTHTKRMLDALELEVRHCEKSGLLSVYRDLSSGPLLCSASAPPLPGISLHWDHQLEKGVQLVLSEFPKLG